MADHGGGANAPLAEVPPHVPPEFVYHYNVFDPAPDGGDTYEALLALKDKAPPIFWTPYVGGHWFTTDGDLAREVMTDTEHFSSQKLMLIREHNPPPGEGFTPIHMDPPEHGIYRLILMKALSRKTVVDLLPKMREFTIDLIEKVKPRGWCDFVHDIADPLPTQIFFYMVDLPESYLDQVRWRVTALHDPAADKAQIFVDLNEIMRPFVHERLAHPGDDLVSWMATQEVEGKPLSEHHIHSMTVLLLTAALGTIVDSFALIVHYLARHPEHRRWIREHPERMSSAVDELFRRHPIQLAGTARYCAKDRMLGGAPIKADDMMLAGPPMMSLDPKVFPNPLEVDWDRPIPINSSFGFGPHRCAGIALSRSMLAILLEELLTRIPDFELSKQDPPVVTHGVNIVYEKLVIEWPHAR